MTINNTSSKTKNNSNKVITVVGPALSGFARVVKAGTQYNSTKPEYNLQIEFDPRTKEGKRDIESITKAHEENIAFERSKREGEEVVDYGVPLHTVDTDEATKNGVKRNPDVFTTGNLKITAKSMFKPGLFGSLRAGDGGNSDISGVMNHELPVGSIVKVKLALISYVQEGNPKTGAKTVAGSSVKLQSVKLIRKPIKKDFEDDDVEVLSFEGDSKTSTTESTSENFNSDFDESTGIE